jgi:transposase
MMGTKTRSFAPLPHDLSLEDLVPKDHFYRRLEATLDLSFVRELVEPLYANGGRPSVDPVVFFKLQLVMFFEDLRSERQLMGVVADRLSLRWYLGYDLQEPLPDHSSLTRIRERFGLEVFRRFFERIVEECVEAGLVWGEELFFDATKVEANASMESRIPRFAAEAHLGELFEGEGTLQSEEEEGGGDDAPGLPTETDLDALPAAAEHELRAMNAQKCDWISRDGKPDRTIVRHRYRRKSDYEVSHTDPDAALMQHKRGASRLGYHTHYVVDGGKARVILSVLVTPAEVMENQPMLDLLWRTIFRWRTRTRRVTGDATYGTKENVAAVEKAGIRAYLSMTDFEKLTPYFGSSRFVYEPEQDLYRCPQGEPLRLYTHSYTERLTKYRAKPETCNACPSKWNYPEVADSFSLRHRNLLHRSLLVVGGTQVAQRRVTPHPVVEPFDVVEDRYPGRLPAGETMPVKQLALQARHEALGDGVIQRRSRPAHRRHDTCFFEPLAERQRGVLHTPVGMVNQPRSGFASPEGHLQSVDHELRAEMVGHRPADHLPGVDVEDEGEIQKALPSMDVSNIRRPDLIRSCGSEVATDEIRGRDGVLVSASSAFPTTSDAALKTRFAHQACNPLPGAAHSQSSELGMDAWVAIDPAAAVMDLSDLLDERCVFTVSFGGRAILPTVVAAP